MAQTLIALVLGALLGLVAERLRWRREDRLRWMEERRPVYARFLAATEKWDDLDWVLAMERGVDGVPGPDWDHAAYLVATDDTVMSRLQARVGEATEVVIEALAEIDLVGSQRAGKAARALWDECSHQASIARESPPRHCGGASEELVAASQAVVDARRRFRDVVRNELGVPD